MCSKSLNPGTSQNHATPYGQRLSKPQLVYVPDNLISITLHPHPPPKPYGPSYFPYPQLFCMLNYTEALAMPLRIQLSWMSHLIHTPLLFCVPAVSLSLILDKFAVTPHILALFVA